MKPSPIRHVWFIMPNGGWVNSEIIFYWTSYDPSVWGFGEVPVYFILDFGDGETFTVTCYSLDDFYDIPQNIGHTYNSAKIYTATLTITSNYYIESASIEVFIRDENPHAPSTPKVTREIDHHYNSDGDYYEAHYYAESDDADGDPIRYHYRIVTLVVDDWYPVVHYCYPGAKQEIYMFELPDNFHIWNLPYATACAVDVCGAESKWGILDVTIPKDNSCNSQGQSQSPSGSSRTVSSRPLFFKY